MASAGINRNTTPARSESSTTAQSSSPIVDARRAQLEQELVKLYKLENSPVVSKDGRLKAGFLGALRGFLQGVATTGNLAGGLGGAISGGVGGAIHPQWRAELQRIAQVHQQQGKADQALKIEKELIELDHLDLQNNALRGDSPAALSKRRQGLMRELQGLMKITGGKFDPSNARQVEIANELQVTPQNKPSSINWQSVRVLRGRCRLSGSLSL